MQIKRLRWSLGAVGLAAALGCSSASSGLSDYFTFLLQDFPVVSGGDTTKVNAYVFVPWGAEDPTPETAPCWLIGFDLKGRAVREINGSRTTDGTDQVKGPTPQTGTYVQYNGDENGALLPSTCLPILTARFTFGGSAYYVAGELIRAFPDPASLTINPGEGSYTSQETGWNLEGGEFVGGGASFWPYEVGNVSANAVRLYPMEPGRR